jgi:hypothetical protein
VVETEKQRKARSYIAGAVKLLDELQYFHGGLSKGSELDAPVALLELARSTIDGRDEAREKKNARDRERRAKAKTQPKAKPKARQRGYAGDMLSPHPAE